MEKDKEKRIKEIDEQIAKLESVLKEMEKTEINARIKMAYLEGLQKGMSCRPFWNIF